MRTTIIHAIEDILALIVNLSIITVRKTEKSVTWRGKKGNLNLANISELNRIK